MALLLHRRKLVSLMQLQWGEVAKAALTAAAAGLLSYQMVRVVRVNGTRVSDIKALGLSAITWAGAVAAGLWFTRSTLPGDLRRRKATVPPQGAQMQVGGLPKGLDP
jgi:putative peptidoglycan lipid II flippase